VVKTPEKVLARLRERPLDYRIALGILDPDYKEWRPEGKPNYRLDVIGGAPLLSFAPEEEVSFFAGVCHVLAPPTQREAPDVAEAALKLGVNEVDILGEAAFRVLRPHMTDGRWFLVRQYGASAGSLSPRSSAAVRRLVRGDAGAVERLCESDSVLTKHSSTQRHFDQMLGGLPVTCYGAFGGDDLVGFCSAFPVCRAVTEVAWLYVLEGHRRRGLASGLLTALVLDGFARGDSVGYYAGWEATSPWLGAMLEKLGFRELMGQYRFIPSESKEEWRTWGIPLR
jgi:GNAT superfamily N-acetyltransferase